MKMVVGCGLGFGSVCSTYNTNKPQTIDMVRLFNFDSSTSNR